MRAREMLNNLRWNPSFTGMDFRVVYRHHGAPQDERCVMISEIEGYHTSDFSIRRRDGLIAYIPYHRVRRIESVEGSPIWVHPCADDQTYTSHRHTRRPPHRGP